MKEDRQKRPPRKNTAKIGGAAYAPQQDEPHSKGEERTPDKPIGQAARANRDPTRKRTEETLWKKKLDPRKSCLQGDHDRQ